MEDIMKSALTTVGFEITNHCNLKCIHCYEGNLGCNKHLSIDLIETIIKKVIPYSPKYFVLTGGEPFLHPDFIKIIKLLGEKYASYRFYIASNGTLVSKEIADILSKYDNIFIQISLDGITEQTHNTQHGNSFTAVIHNIDILTNKIPHNRISVQMTISKINYRECIDVAEYAKKLKIDIRFQYVCMVGSALKHQDMLYMSPVQKTATYLKLKQFSKDNPEMNIVAPKTLLSCSFEDLNTPISMNIDINGEVVTCTCFDSSFSLGNIFTSSIDSILTSPKIKEIHDRVLRRK